MTLFTFIIAGTRVGIRAETEYYARRAARMLMNCDDGRLRLEKQEPVKVDDAKEPTNV